LAFARFFIGTNGLNGFIQLFPETLTLLRVFNALFATHGIAVFAFSMYIFNSDFFRKYKYAVCAVFAVIFFTSIAVHPGSTWYIPIMSALMLPFGVFTIVFAARSAAFKENAILRLYFAAVVIFIVFGATFIVFLRAQLFMPALLNNVFLIMVQGLVLSRRYTDALEAEQRLAAENATLDRVNRLRAEMVATISHEARTPLAVLASYASLVAVEMQEKHTDPQVTADLDKIAFEAKRVANLIDHMKDLPLRKEKAAERIPLDMGELVLQTTRLYAHILERRGVTLITDIAPKLPSIIGNPDELTQVVFNLLQNAKNHTTRGSVTITIRAENGYLLTTITDTGAGIAPDILPHIFEHGVHGSGGGTGIGLAVCKVVINDHGGTIDIESEQGKGTAITFVLPMGGESNGS
ncbi:MAG: HAMP domain-containing histidine kinase, partial [Defluviitaleaceae bacterium]|nr:HAMP domain-containing histidine kinase [Defluviitaleaceae bacterium]